MKFPEGYEWVDVHVKIACFVNEKKIFSVLEAVGLN
jgi:hypothetical protein